ncbi:MAG: CHAT domain-containing protein [Candidatus Aminicenantes bacterium]|nr:CHAT domain-containing protein [Candidatus Aminicenantes bacterium]
MNGVLKTASGLGWTLAGFIFFGFQGRFWERPAIRFPAGRPTADFSGGEHRSNRAFPPPAGREKGRSPIAAERVTTDIHLPPGDREAIVEYRLGETESRVSLFAGNRVWAAVLPEEDRIERSVLGFIKETGRSSGNLDSIRKAARRIAVELIPFDRELAGLRVDQLIVIPDGILNCLAFEALRTADNRAFLVEKYSVSYAPSETALKSFWTKPGLPGRRLLAVGASDPDQGRSGDAPGAYFRCRAIRWVRNEIDDVSRLFDRNHRCVYLDREANEENIKRHRGERFQVIHIASHGRPDDRVPARAALILSRSPGDDGDLRAEEISGLGMAADLVVLSACRTASGAVVSPEGAGGLPLAFMRAGARSVMATLWRVPDRSTAEFMADFYRHLKSGLGKSRALRAAKVDMIRRGRSHPFFWAGYVLQGEPNEKIVFD